MKYSNHSILFLKSVSFYTNPNYQICDFRTLEKCILHSCYPSSPIQRHFHKAVVLYNHYDTLKIAKDSSHKEIKLAYIEMAKNFHPDVNPGDPNAEKIFKEISTAYETLGNETSKKVYDNNMILAEYRIRKSRSKPSPNRAEEEEILRKKYPEYYTRKKQKTTSKEEFNPFSPRDHFRKHKKENPNDETYFSKITKDEDIGYIVLAVSVISFLVMFRSIWIAARHKKESGKKTTESPCIKKISQICTECVIWIFSIFR